ncbi:uncharacterized protein LOC131596144 [Vicia villosa]|uniref:uncharacterized protein LOC131596144 n=1 Tax=Vicia villosa TaxID=3911 RepID=UPI00273B9885|nr:uncharacterized protein LOC131596144 [Vicia villosa]
MQRNFKDNGNGWKMVNRNKGKSTVTSRWDIWKSDSGEGNGSVISFFITDFDDCWRAKDLYYELKDFGSIEEIVIPPKKDWRGTRYGFVRFFNVEDARILETKLDNVWLGEKKISANITKYNRKEVSRKNDSGRGKYGGTRGKLNTTRSNPKVSLPSNSGPSKSFTDVLKGQVSEVKRVDKEDNKAFFYQTSLEEKNMFCKAKMGVAAAPGLAFGVKQGLIEEGIFTVKATPLGPNLCLLEEVVAEDLDMFLAEGGEWIKRWFKEVREWKPSDVECARAVWISAYGIPCHVRNKRFIDTLFSDIGTVANYEWIQHASSRLDVVKIMVFSKEAEIIRNKVSVCLDGMWTNILLIEEAQWSTGEEECASGFDSSSSDGSVKGSSSALGSGREEEEELIAAFSESEYLGNDERDGSTQRRQQEGFADKIEKLRMEKMGSSEGIKCSYMKEDKGQAREEKGCTEDSISSTSFSKVLCSLEAVSSPKKKRMTWQV